MFNSINKLIIVSLIIFPYNLFGLGTNSIILEHNLVPSQSYQNTVRIYTSQKEIQINVYPWTINKKGDTVIKYGQPFDHSWLTIPKLVQKIASHNYIDINYEINLPPDPKQAEYLANLIIFPIQKSNQNVSISTGLSIPLYVSVKNLIKLSLLMDQFHYNKEQKMIQFNIKNNSNVHIRPKIEYQLFKIQGVWPFESHNLISKADINNNHLPILAKSSRDFSSKIALDVGRYKIKFIIQYGQIYQIKHELIKEIFFNLN